LHGLNPGSFLTKNATPCFNSMMWTYYNEIPIAQIYYYYGDFEDNVFNMTELVSNASHNLDKCVSASQDVYNFL